MARIGNHNYSFYEIRYHGTRRGVRIIIEHIGAGNNACEYKLDLDSNPHNLDYNWYRRNITSFYTQLGTAVAEYLEGHQVEWNENIHWPAQIEARIHGVDYTATRQ